ncbi:UvrD-helicase domain-containing protein [Zunongwangia profunda]|jgi:superfamily I DNA/RNA helicase|uniref:UvrD-helicase domain-containing protein n=1 Tax=Zunongwangia profunda TaxID=398743 RepID=UPI000EC53427|nr:UvrD-helicase domain-containing protein [Zunongwangia profunda]MCC4228658.1 UvrD-helicase domain-containing protein [Zunongwangia profunda]HAJ81230.1 hypothetical protein [Zunongwangia profunda]|tara:strand:- start:1266 stop:3080 length:1815 start_codon:yes stop_codon:yes gene_type:complete
MNIDITSELQAYLDASGKVVLNACPGGGKTTAIAQKIINLEPQYLKKYDAYSGIACLSFTNAAKDELNETYSRLCGKTLSYPSIISTIDSFINIYITLPYYYLLQRDFARPRILENNKKLNKFWNITYTQNGKVKQGISRPLLEFKNKAGKYLYFVYPPADIRIEPDGTFSLKGIVPSEDKVDPEKFINYCKYIKNWQFKRGLITTNDSSFIALTLLKKFPKIAIWLSKRFPHIIVDEAQDNSLLQHQVFDKLQEHGLKNIEFIGDPYQSLYEFRDANPQLFLSKFQNDSYQGLELTDNRRSPQHIIDCFSLLRPDTASKINTACTEDLKEPILIYRYSTEDRSKVVQHFDDYCYVNNYDQRKVVVRGNTVRNKMLGRNAVEEPWKSNIPYELITARIEYEDNNLREAVRLMRSIVIDLKNPEATPSKKAELREDLKTDYNHNAKLIKLIKNLPQLTNTVEVWSQKCCDYIEKHLGIDATISFKIKRASTKFQKTTRNEPVNHHFKRVDIAQTNALTTVHQVKGKTLDAILVFFDEKNHKENINFRDIEPEQNGFISEKKRIIYVAMSRAKHLLAMAFPLSISDKQITDKFGDNVIIVKSAELT